MGIHYDYKSTRGAKAMEKQAKREKKLAEKRAKKNAKTGFVKTKAEANSKEIAKNGRNCRLPNIQFLLKACGVAIVQHQ